MRGIETWLSESLRSMEQSRMSKKRRDARLAILKISQNNLESLRKNTRYAKQDYRDVLAWAEYRKQSKNWPKPNSPKKQKLIKKDKQQYKEWLNND